jgi:hypothetical protein
MTDDNVRQLVLDTIASLRQARSETTRTHIQKTVFMAEQLGIVPPESFEFVLHLYGPYSFDLDQSILDLLASKELTVAPGPGGMGGSYSTDYGVPRTELQPLAEWLGRKGVRALEAITTVAYVEARGEPGVIARVLRIKPHLGEAEVLRARAEVEKAKREVVRPPLG